MPSFDTVLEADLVEVKNAVDQVAREVGTRFDFKGTSAGIELKDKDITLFGDADFQLQQVEEVLRNKLAKRNVDVRFLDIGKVEKIGGDKVKQVVKVKNGISTEDGKKIQQAINRIDAGDYGFCEETGEAIGVARLMARPTASLSLEAQQRRELKQKMFGD